jgi:hypothetical protein
MKNFLLFTVFFAAMLTACQKDKTPMQMIQGKWKASKWLVDGIPKTGFDIGVINFEFKKDSIYIARLGMQSEEGTFNLKNNCFNAKSIYGSNKKCPIIKMTHDTMIWVMDSVNEAGHLYLVRIKD